MEQLILPASLFLLFSRNLQRAAPSSPQKAWGRRLLGERENSEEPAVLSPFPAVFITNSKP
ncbi:MAG: hypothetical protein JO110_02310 [Acetobacteraceae bacterium]|nr:hypothetical protein [Acetobacteraceae bacterium]